MAWHAQILTTTTLAKTKAHKQKQKVKAELEAEPLMCGSIETKLKDKFKWLGQILSSEGLADCVAATVASREGKIRGACLEIAQIVTDWQKYCQKCL